MKKVISPGSKRKNNQSNKTFGVTLEELMKRELSSAAIVPAVVCKICDFILSDGVEQEGIFRISGSMRVVEKIRASFDKSGEANLREDHDIMAVASSLKLFLRELPIPLIPEALTNQFIQLEDEHGEESSSAYIFALMPLIQHLPQHHYNLLKYLIYFLVKVSCFESSNKMHANALAIVFGPNIFRCGAGISGLHDQAITNKVIHKLILYFDDVFISPPASPKSTTTVIKVEQTRSPRTPPPRPPPPKLGTSSPVSSPRSRLTIVDKIETKTNLYNGTIPVVNGHTPNSASLTVAPMSSMKMISPRLSDEDSGRASPFILDSENGHSLLESPVVPRAASELVEKTINKTIREHMFGDVDVSTTASSLDDASHDILDSDTLVEGVQSRVLPHPNTGSPPDTPPKPLTTDPLSKALTPQRPAPPQKYTPTVGKREDMQQQSSSEKQEPSVPVNDLIRQFQQKSHSGLHETGVAKTQRPNSTVFTGGKNSHSQMTTTNEQTTLKQQTSSNEKMTPKQQKQQTTTANEQTTLKQQTSNEKTIPKQQKQQTISNEKTPKQEARAAVDNNIPNFTVGGRPRNNIDGGNSGSPRLCGRSKSEGKSPVPLLDFSTLHRQIKCEEARPAEKGFSPLPGHNNQPNVTLYIDVMAKQENNSVEDEAPLSPHAYESPYDASIDANALKQANKRIHSVKRKIKSYEENFQKEHGYKPSLREKTSNPDVKKYITELNKCKKEVKRLKEDVSLHNINNSHPLADDNEADSTSDSASLQRTLDDLLTRLHGKRVDAGRPEDVTLMNAEQIQYEKLAVQKALLQFESTHGRPSTREEKDVMRPLYDRYRTIKRILTKSASINADPDLQTVPEDYDIDHHDTAPTAGRWANPVKIPTGLTDEFTITRDMGLLRETNRPIMIENLTPDTVTPDDDGDYLNSHLHHLSTQELRDELQFMNREKKELRKILRQYEDDFYRENGRKVQKEDRIPLSGEYLEYKRVKSRLKLLEVLVSKR